MGSGDLAAQALQTYQRAGKVVHTAERRDRAEAQRTERGRRADQRHTELDVSRPASMAPSAFPNHAMEHRARPRTSEGGRTV